MRFRTILSLATLFVFCFTAAVWSLPTPAQTAAHSSNAAENQSVAGKISAVGDATFALQVAKDNQPQTMQFLIDDKTRVEGKLAIGSQAVVEYRADSAGNVAVHVVVTPSSGLHY